MILGDMILIWVDPDYRRYLEMYDEDEEPAPVDVDRLRHSV
jgi:hypothetical protein